MAEYRIDSIIDLQKVQSELDATKGGVKELIALIQSIKGKSLDIMSSNSVGDVTKMQKELDALKKQTIKSVEDLEKARKKDAAAAEKQAAASEKAAKKAAEEARPYKQLAAAFAAAAKEAQDLAAQYGRMDPKAQAAAKRANELNNQLKAIDASIGNHQRNVGNYASAFDKVGSSIKSLGTQFLAAIGIFSAASILESSVDEFLQLDKNVRQLENTLKNIGVPEAFGRIEGSIKSLRKEFKFTSESDLTNTFQKLITYGKLTEKQINDLLPVIVNFSAQTGQSIEASTDIILKSLEGNNRGLREFGINLRDAKTPAEALSLVMKELAPRVEGAGKAFAESAAGGIAASKQEFADLKTEIGEGLIPALNSLLNFLIGAVKGAKLLYNDLKDLFTLKPVGSTNTANFITAQTKTDVEKLIQGLEGLDLEEKQKRINGLIFSQQEVLRLAKDNQYLFAKGIGTQADDIRFFGTEAEKKSNIDYAKGVIKLLSEKKKLIQSETDTNKVIGFGDPNKPFVTPKTKDDSAKKAEELAERIRKANFEAAKAAQQENIKLQEDIFKDESKSFDERIAALREFVQEKARLIELERQFEKGAKGLTKEEIVAIETAKQTELNQLVRDGHTEYNKILDGKLKDEQKLEKENADRIKKIHEDLQKSIEQGLKDANDKLKEKIKEREDIEKEAAKLRGELANESIGLAFDILTAQYEKEKNLIQDQIDLLEKKKQKDIEVANATITNAQDRAAAITVIEARAAAEQAILEQKKRQINIQQARFEKAESIANIIAKTAEAIIASLAKTPPPAGLPLALLMGAIGAAQLARVIATPIPRYRQGTPSHKGGLMIVGDGGRPEGIELPDGTIMKTPAVPTLMDAPKGTKVHKDYGSMMLRATITNVPVYKEVTRSGKTDIAVAKMEKSVVSAIKKIPQPIVRAENIISRTIRRGGSNTTIIGRNA